MQDKDTAPTTPAETTVYYDGSCALCSAEIGFYASRPGSCHLRFVDVSDPEAETGPDLDQDSAMRRFHVRLPDGSLTSGARGFLAVWHALPGWRWAARLGQARGVALVLEGLYRLFLPIRPTLSRIAAWLGAKPRNPRA